MQHSISHARSSLSIPAATNLSPHTTTSRWSQRPLKTLILMMQRVNNIKVPTMQRRRGATRRDLPALLLFYGIIVWVFAILFACSDIGRLAAGSPLETVSGTVVSVFRREGKAGNYFNLIVQTPGGLRHLTQEDLLMWPLPEAHHFIPGDRIRAKVRHQTLHDLEWCWELNRNGIEILTLDQTERYLQTTDEKDRRFNHKFNLWALAISIGLLGCAFALRRHFGSWTDKTRGSSAELSLKRSPADTT